MTNGLVRRVTAAGDRRRVDITLTAAGRRLARQIAAIEDRIYQNLDAGGEGHDVAAVIAYLRAVVAGTRARGTVPRRASVVPPEQRPVQERRLHAGTR